MHYVVFIISIADPLTGVSNIIVSESFKNRPSSWLNLGSRGLVFGLARVVTNSLL